MLTRKTRIERTRQEIDRDFATKERIEYSKLPDDKTGSKGERHLFKPNDDDDYIVVRTRQGWQVGQFISVELTSPSNSVGRDGEVRILQNDAYEALIYKANGTWYILNATTIGAVTGIDTMILGTGGAAPTRLIKPKILGMGGVNP